MVNLEEQWWITSKTVIEKEQSNKTSIVLTWNPCKIDSHHFCKVKWVYQLQKVGEGIWYFSNIHICIYGRSDVHISKQILNLWEIIPVRSRSVDQNAQSEFGKFYPKLQSMVPKTCYCAADHVHFRSDSTYSPLSNPVLYQSGQVAFPIFGDEKLSWTKVAKSLFRFLGIKKPPWTKVAKSLFWSWLVKKPPWIKVAK